MNEEKLVANIKTVKAADLSQSQRAIVIDKILELLKLQVGVWKSDDKEEIVFREVKE